MSWITLPILLYNACMEERIDSRLKQALNEGVFTAGIVGVIDTLERRMLIPVGSYLFQGKEQNVTSSSVFDVASITKVIPVSLLALSLIDKKELSLHRKIKEIIPEIQTNYRDEITVWHLLTQTLDFHRSLASLKDASPEELLTEIMTTQFRYAPGEKMNYANASSILLGMILERTTNTSLDTLADALLFKPLGMRSTSFHPETFEQSVIVPTEDDMRRGRIIRGEIHDESAHTLRQKMIPGSAGLFSTAPDLLNCLQMLLQKGVYNGVRFFSEEMIGEMQTNQLESIGDWGGLGWELNQERYMGSSGTDKIIGKTGFTGCLILVAITRGKGLVFLTNYHFPKRKETADALNMVRRDISDIVFGHSI